MRDKRRVEEVPLAAAVGESGLGRAELSPVAPRMASPVAPAKNALRNDLLSVKASRLRPSAPTRLLPEAQPFWPVGVRQVRALFPYAAGLGVDVGELEGQAEPERDGDFYGDSRVGVLASQIPTRLNLTTQPVSAGL